MKLSDYTSRVAALTGINRFLMLLLIGSSVVNLFLAFFIVTTDRSEKIIITPPIVERSFWVQGEDVSEEYLSQMATWFLSLNLTYNSDNARAQAEILLPYLHPSKHAALSQKIEKQLVAIKRYNESSVFYITEVAVLNNDVALIGDLRRTAGRTQIENRKAAYKVSFKFDTGRLTVYDISEVKVDDPFNSVISTD